MDSDNEDSYIAKILEKLQDGTLKIILHGNRYKCPWDNKPKDRVEASLLQHATSLSTIGNTARIRANHKALMMYLQGQQG